MQLDTKEILGIQYVLGCYKIVIESGTSQEMKNAAKIGAILELKEKLNLDITDAGMYALLKDFDKVSEFVENIMDERDKLRDGSNDRISKECKNQILNVRHEALDYLSELSPQVAIPAMEEMLSKEDSDVLKKVISSYIEQLKSLIPNIENKEK